MNGDNIIVVFIDQTATSEWDDLFIGIQTSARQVDDLAYSAETMDSTVTLKQAVNIMLAALAGKSTGGGGAMITLLHGSHSNGRITGTVGGAGLHANATTGWRPSYLYRQAADQGACAGRDREAGRRGNQESGDCGRQRSL